jgi:hypothetical protein
VEPNLVFGNLPLWWVGCFGWWSVIAQAKAFPGNVPERDRVNLSQQIGVIGYGWQDTVGDPGGGPEFEQVVDYLL